MIFIMDREEEISLGYYSVVQKPSNADSRKLTFLARDQ